MAVATSTCLLATDSRLVSWPALRTVLKQFRGSTPWAAKMKVVGTRNPEVELGSPMPKSSDLSHVSTSSSELMAALSLWATRIEK